MAEITSALVKQLRDLTGVGMMDCKNALVEAQGDLEAAKDVLRKKSIHIAVNRVGREAREGVITQYILPGARVGVLVEVNCQTDFVAKTESFRAFADEAARRLAEEPEANLEPLRVEQVHQTGENVKISRCQRLERGGIGLIAAYIHHGAKIGVLVEVGAGQESTVDRAEFKDFVKDITLQVAAANPTAVSREEIDPAVVAKEKEIAAEQVKGKPPQALEKIVQGKLAKFFQSVCLLEQGFVKKNAEITVREHLDHVARTLGDQIQIRRFIRFQVGETLKG